MRLREQTASATPGSSPEAVATAVAGALVGWFAGVWMHPVVGAVMAAVAGLNGAISGWRQIYPWRLTAGVIAFVLDSTWAVIPVFGSLLAHLGAALRKDSGYEASLSRRRSRHVYQGGLTLKPGFALTVGNVIAGAGDLSGARRRRLVTDHEYVHVWQARWFGPLYLVIYGLWAGLGALVGIVVWLVRGRREKLGVVVESVAYYLNPFEWWAYSRDNLWPPPAKVKDLGYRRAAVRPLAATRVERGWSPEIVPRGPDDLSHAPTPAE